MVSETRNFISVLNKYVLYSEALSQYYQLDEADQKIIEPYIRYLKEGWQEELRLVNITISALSKAAFYRL